MTNDCANTRRNHTAAETTDGLLCWPCRHRLEQHITGLPGLVHWLTVNVAAQNRGGERVAGSRNPPIPVSLTVLALLGTSHDCAADNCPGGHDPAGADTTPSIPSELDGWIRLVLDEHPDRLHGPGPQLHAASRWLVARLDWIVEQPWVGEMCVSLDRVWSVANAAAPMWHSRDKPRPLPCPHCDLRALLWRPPWVECHRDLGGCGALLTQREYDGWVRRWAAYARDHAEAVA